MRRLLALVFVTLALAVPLSACGSGAHSTGHHALLKSAAGALIVHHELKKHHVKHPLAKSLAAGAVIHHVVKHH